MLLQGKITKYVREIYLTEIEKKRRVYISSIEENVNITVTKIKVIKILCFLKS